MITAKIGGRLISFTQSGLAAGQKYKVSIRGERDEKMGPESTTEFTTGESVIILGSWFRQPFWLSCFHKDPAGLFLCNYFSSSGHVFNQA